MVDEIRVLNIEEDGTITFETDGISRQNHKSADEFLSIIEELCNSEFVTTKRPRKLHHNKHTARHKAGF